MMLRKYLAWGLIVLADYTAAVADDELPVVVIDKLPIGRLAFVTGKHFGSVGAITVLGQQIDPFQGSNPHFAPGDNAIYFSKHAHSKSCIFLRDLSKQTTTEIDVDDHEADSPSISAANGDLIFVAWTKGRKSSHIYLDDGKTFIALTNGNHYDWSPCWSPDGKQIVFESTRDGERQIYVMDQDGKNQTNLSNDKILSHAPCWSPDGRQIAYMSVGTAKKCCIFVMNKDGSDKRNLSNGTTRDSEPAWSPDGEWIAFTRTTDDPPGTQSMNLWIMKKDGTDQQQVTRNKQQVSSYGPAWTSDE